MHRARNGQALALLAALLCPEGQQSILVTDAVATCIDMEDMAMVWLIGASNSPTKVRVIKNLLIRYRCIE